MPKAKKSDYLNKNSLVKHIDITQFRDLGLDLNTDELPRGLTSDNAALLESPEGTPLLVVSSDAF